MKFKNPKGKEIGDLAIMLGGVVAGAIVSRAAISAIHTPTAGADETTKKKEATILLAKRGGIVVVAGYAGAGISGTDTVSTLVKGACIGAAGIQVIDGTKDVLSSNATLANPTTSTARIAANALGVKGLGCPCDEAPATTWMNGARRRRRSLNAPVSIDENAQPVNEFERILLSSQQASA